jgi:hypothetical protein
MSTLVRLLIAVVLIAHGVGHTLGLFPILSWFQAEGWSDQSWLLTPLLGEGVVRWVGVIIWVFVSCAFVVLGLALLVTATPLTWWRSLAIVAALLSLAGIILYPSAFPGQLNIVGAVVVDLSLLVALFWLHWPATQLADSP